MEDKAVVEQVGNMLINDGTFLLDECIQRARELRQSRARLADPSMVDPQQVRVCELNAFLPVECFALP